MKEIPHTTTLDWSLSIPDLIDMPAGE